MYFTYTLILALGLLITCPYYLLRFRKYWPTLSDRFGYLKFPELPHSIWVHAVSVGEVKAVERLLERLRQQFPGRKLVVSTATPAGQQLARERRDIIHHTFYFPIDLPWCVRRALDRLNPEIVIIAETEIWPNFLRACRARGVRVIMINGRISDKSFARYRLVRRWLRRVFEDYAIIGMQSERDRRRIEAIGADPQKITVFGNLKYDVTASARPLDKTLAAVLRDWNPVWIAASTRAGEEEMVLEAFADLLATDPDLKLIIAPRHGHRFDAVEQLIKRRRMTCVRRTRLAPAHNANVLLLDTFGELAAVFQYGTVVFMGGSLVPRGGHNVLEPARYGKPVVFGPHMENFRDMARLFVESEGAIQIQSPLELAPAVRRLLCDPAHAGRLGRNALAIVQQNSGATDRILEVLEPVEARR